MELLLSPEAWIAFFTLTALELVLGIDNIIFISILVDRLPRESREKARIVGLFFAMFLRVSLLVFLAWMVGATEPLFHIGGLGFSPRDLILIGGGVFLLWKSTEEIREMVKGHEATHKTGGKAASARAIILQIIVIDLVFSLDSIITAVGMVKQIEVMIAAVITSVGLMMLFAKVIGDFVSDNPGIKMLALAFLWLVGAVLVVDGFSVHVPKAYIYVAMAFSLGVELLNMQMRKNINKLKND